MHCMKCGRKVEASKSFCPACLEEMEKYPVKANAVVQLPVHPEAAPVKKRSFRRKRPVKPEEQIVALNRSRHRLIFLLSISLLAVLGLFLILLILLERQDFAPIKDAIRLISSIFS